MIIKVLNHQIKKAILVSTLILVMALCFSACSQSANLNNRAELSQYLGYTIADVERALNVELIDMSQYQNYENTFRAEKRDGEFDCIIDSTGTIVKIRLISSGREQFSILGVTSNLEDNSAFDTLIGNGATNVFGPYWMCSNGVDAVYLDSNHWTIEKDSSILKEALLRVAAEEAFSFEYDDSEGAFYIGNGQIIEYYYGSFARFVYDYNKLTSYQKGAANQIIDGRYVLVSGTVTAVNSDGSISVFCQDDEASQADGLIWPMQGNANLFVVPQQENQLINISNNSTIVALGRIDANSYNTMLIANFFDLNDVVIVSINEENLDIPSINERIPGVFTYNQDNTSNSGETQNDENPPIIDYDEFWDSNDWYQDELTGAYFDGENNIYFQITAGLDSSGNVTYWLSYSAGGEVREIDGEYVEISKVLEIPSYKIIDDDDGRSVLFKIDNYYPEYGGNFELRAETLLDGNLDFYILVDIPGLLSTNGNFMKIPRLY